MLWRLHSTSLWPDLIQLTYLLPHPVSLLQCQLIPTHCTVDLRENKYLYQYNRGGDVLLGYEFVLYKVTPLLKFYRASQVGTLFT